MQREFRAQQEHQEQMDSPVTRDHLAMWDHLESREIQGREDLEDQREVVCRVRIDQYLVTVTLTNNSLKHILQIDTSPCYATCVYIKACIAGVVREQI